MYTVDKKQKPKLLAHLIKENNWEQVLVFTRTKHGANRLTRNLEDTKITATAIHSNKSQGARTKALADFKQGIVRILVATDIAARGLDIVQLPHVINFDLPNVPEDYIHRIGRTGRAGFTGEAISLVSADEYKQLNDIEKLLKNRIERRVNDNFVPIHIVAESDIKSLSSKKGRTRRKKPQQTENQQTEQSNTNIKSKRFFDPKKKNNKTDSSKNSSKSSKPNSNFSFKGQNFKSNKNNIKKHKLK